MSVDPLLSVVIPTYRRPDQLARCLEALADQDYAADRYEVIVVDDGSPEPAEGVVSRFADDGRFEVVRQPNAGPATARNTGAARARGALIFFTDDDCAPEPGWLRTLAEAHDACPEAALGGSTTNALDRNPYSAASQLLIDYLYGYFNADPEAARFVASNNFAVPAVGFHDAGGFANDFPLAAGEDRELCDRWVAQGRAMRFVPAARVDHYHGLSFRRFVRQHFGYGRGGYQFQVSRAERGSETRIEPLRFYSELLWYPFTRLPLGRAAVTSALFFVTQVANAAGFFFERWRQRDQQAGQAA